MKSVITAVVNRLLYYMGERNLTQYRLAQLSGLPFATVKSIMQRRANGVGLKTLIMLAHGLGMTVSEFLDDPSFSYDSIGED